MKIDIITFSVYVCMYVYIYVCMYVCMYLHSYFLLGKLILN